jgi:predicted PurR-regulated permease PerM/GNAT superfamily N-acetyltransferase
MDISPRWSTTTKFIVMLAILAVVAFLLLRFQGVIAPLILAVILAYLLNPIVTALAKFSRLSRTLAILLVYLILILLLLGLVSGAGLLIQQQFSGILSTALTFINSIPTRINSLSSKPDQLGPFTLDLSKTDATALQNELIPTARDWIGRITNWMTGAASETATTMAWAGFVFIISYYLIHDMNAMEKGVLRLVPEESQKDAQRLLADLGPIWNAFLRGQLLLSLIMGSAFGLVMSLLGLRYALVIALMAALMEFVPVIGPYLTAGTTILIALFQPFNWLGFSPTVYTLCVAAAALLLQQLEANFLSPRVMGRQLRMHPAILITGAFVGASLMGIPGLLLSGPILATTRLFGRYVHAKLFNLPPWPDRTGGTLAGFGENAVFCRPAREADKPDVLEMTARVWEGHDYVPRVWSEWLADREGILAVAERNGRVVGIGKLTRLAPGEWWIEGLRVHPDYQGMKIGSQIFEYLLGQWRERGGGVIRLATSSERVQVHHLCDRLGFRPTETFLVMAAAPTKRGENAFELIAEADASAAFALSKKSARARSASGLVNTSWRWGRLTEDRMREFARRDRAWWWKNRTAALMLYDSDHESEPSLEIAAVLSSDKHLAVMLGQARRLAGLAGVARLAWAMPNLPAAAKAAKRAGFTQEWDGQLWIFERPSPQAAEQTSGSAQTDPGLPGGRSDTQPTTEVRNVR